MTPREKLARAYSLAFHPPTLNRVWYEIRDGRVPDLQALGEQLDMALTLHGALPEDGCSSQRALTRLALLQARSRQFGMVTFLRNLRRRLGRPEAPYPGVVPGHLVRDVELPEFTGRPHGKP